MIVDKDRKVIYLHNPKCGGTFLRDIYMEKYGETDATKWWKPFTIQHGTDLAHINYNDLPRFIPDWEDYRVVVMVRNPYNRFYSALKELRKQTVCKRGDWPAYIYNGEYQEWGWLRKKIEFLRYKPFFSFMFKKKKFLHNKRIPWLNPQSYFTGERTEVLYYENAEDWQTLFDAFGLSEYSGKLKIAADYAIPETERKMIEKLYPEDVELFRHYNRK